MTVLSPVENPRDWPPLRIALWETLGPSPGKTNHDMPLGLYNKPVPLD